LKPVVSVSKSRALVIGTKLKYHRLKRGGVRK